MKRKILFLATIVLATLALASTVRAAPDLEIFGYTDKIQYKVGETGTVNFWIYNWGPDTALLKNITIYYPWYSPIWGGNNTIIIPDASSVLSKDKNYSDTDTFKVPEDARARGGSIDFTVYYEFGGSTYHFHGSVPIEVVTAPTYGSLQDMDKIVTLFTVLVVLLIVCTAIIAATLFLTGHRTKVTWKEEKPE